MAVAQAPFLHVIPIPFSSSIHFHLVFPFHYLALSFFDPPGSTPLARPESVKDEHGDICIDCITKCQLVLSCARDSHPEARSSTVRPAPTIV